MADGATFPLPVDIGNGKGAGNLGTGMASTKRHGHRPPISVAMVLLVMFLICLAIAGGASRADALGQSIVRFVASIAIAILVLVRGWPREGMPRGPLFLLFATMMLPLLQLIPLPPAVWSALPGRVAFLGAAQIAGVPQPWRPIAISPDAAWNAFFSLLIPAAALLLTAALNARERMKLPAILLAMASYSAVLAVIQLSSGGLDNPFINETVGTGSGIFANPNHQALFLSIGIVAGAAWAVAPQSYAAWRVAVAGAAAIWFFLMILASGSRTGLILGVLASGGAVWIMRQVAVRLSARMSRRARWLAVSATIAIVAVLALVSIAAGRAVSFDRLLLLSTGEDMRSRALPTLFDMVMTYMPVGSGFGGFEPLFQMHEPDALLKPTRFNHAHNDYIEIALEGGVAAILLLVAAMGWVLRSGLAAWRSHPVAPATKFGVVTLLLVLTASAVDYPARTPVVMALLAIAAVLVAPIAGMGGNPLRPETDRV